jgi:hypothetical protein
METFVSNHYSKLLFGPHSLGTLIEWKQATVDKLQNLKIVPTRWGH